MNREDPDEMLQCLLGQTGSSQKNEFLKQIITCDPSIHIMNHSDLKLYQTLWYSPLDYKGLKILSRAMKMTTTQTLVTISKITGCNMLCFCSQLFSNFLYKFV